MIFLDKKALIPSSDNWIEDAIKLAQKQYTDIGHKA